jgi:hypothetical protein
MREIVTAGEAPNILEGLTRTKKHLEALEKLIDAALARSFLILERLGYPRKQTLTAAHARQHWLLKELLPSRNSTFGNRSQFHLRPFVRQSDCRRMAGNGA